MLGGRRPFLAHLNRFAHSRPYTMETLLQAPRSSPFIVEAELTWTGNCFERHVQVHVNANGDIQNITNNIKQNVTRLPGYALVPGMINVHSHAFQRGLRGLGETYPKNSGQSSFWTWREEMYKLVQDMTDDRIYALTHQCFSEMLDAGITSVGEFHYFHHGQDRFAYDDMILKAAHDVGIRLVLLNAFYQYGGFNNTPMSIPQKRFETTCLKEYWTQMDALQAKINSSIQSLGVVAHSMRAVALNELKMLHQESQKRGLVFHIHLEEQLKEIEDCKRTHDGQTPMGLLLKHLQVDDKLTAVHCTWTESEQLKEFVSKQGNVCICPLTEVGFE